MKLASPSLGPLPRNGGLPVAWRALLAAGASLLLAFACAPSSAPPPPLPRRLAEPSSTPAEGAVATTAGSSLASPPLPAVPALSSVPAAPSVAILEDDPSPCLPDGYELVAVPDAQRAAALARCLDYPRPSPGAAPARPIPDEVDLWCFAPHQGFNEAEREQFFVKIAGDIGEIRARNAEIEKLYFDLLSTKGALRDVTIARLRKLDAISKVGATRVPSLREGRRAIAALLKARRYEPCSLCVDCHITGEGAPGTFILRCGGSHCGDGPALFATLRLAASTASVVSAKIVPLDLPPLPGSRAARCGGGTISTRDGDHERGGAQETAKQELGMVHRASVSGLDHRSTASAGEPSTLPDEDHMGAMMFGKDEKLTCIEPVQVKGPGGEPLCLAYKTTKRFFVAGLYLSDDGYVLRLQQDETRFFPLTSERTAELQAGGLLPRPLPGYSIPVIEYAMGYSLYIVIAVVAVWGVIETRRTKARRAKDAATPLSLGPPTLTTEADKWLDAQVRPLLRPGETVRHQAYTLPAKPSETGMSSAATYVVLTDQRIFLFATRAGAFGPLLETSANEIIDVRRVARVAVDDDDVIALVLDSARTCVMWSHPTKKLSNQEAFRRDVPRILGGTATFPAERESAEGSA